MRYTNSIEIEDTTIIIIFRTADSLAACSVYTIDMHRNTTTSVDLTTGAAVEPPLGPTASAAPILQIEDFQARVLRKRYRRDEPRLGAVVHFESLAQWEHFVTRTAKPGDHPFHNPAGHYVFVLTGNLVDAATVTSPSTEAVAWSDRVARAMHSVFHKHRILHAVFMASRVNGAPFDQIGYYDPFYRRTVVNNNASTNGSDIVYGALKWTQLQDIDLTTFWILNLAKNFQGRQFRSAMFRRYPTMIPTAEVSPAYLRSYLANVAEYAADFSGFDGIVLGNLAKHHNFRVVSVLNNDTKYGVKLPNATFTGMCVRVCVCACMHAARLSCVCLCFRVIDCLYGRRKWSL